MTPSIITECLQPPYQKTKADL